MPSPRPRPRTSPSTANSSRPQSNTTADRKSQALSLAASDSASIVPIPPSDAGDANDTDDDAASLSCPLPIAVPLPLSLPEPDIIESRPSASDPDLPSPPAKPGGIASSTSLTQPIPWNLEICVGDPMKVSDPLSSHIVYTVKTKTECPAFRSSNLAVVRRYRDFLWLFSQLLTKYPGIVIPPVPEKHALGRFQDDFVENRRASLERFLKRIASHPILSSEDDFRLFLQSETFNIDVNQKRKHESPRTGGLFGRLGQSLTIPTPSFGKVVEVDQWFETKKAQIDTLEAQLKALLKALDGLVKQRRDLALAIAEFGDSMLALAQIEVSKPLAFHLTTLGETHKRIQEIHEKQAKQDIQSVVATTDEYIRIIASTKKAFEARTKSYQVCQTLDANLAKKNDALEKMRGSKGRQDRRVQLGAEIDEAESAVEQAKKDFEEISRLLRSELARFDVEKVADFAESMRQFLKDFGDSQNEIIAQWESYFSRVARAPKDSAAIQAKANDVVQANSQPVVTEKDDTASSAVTGDPLSV
ncbi:hypothetical protein SeMB42_g02583 [Synchytrium endobioticum]|nr:hypothetical protein SeMB42_g02583 [Synchytrium endobioticum]